MALHKSNSLSTGTVALNSSTATIVRADRNDRIFLQLLNNDAAILIYIGQTSAVSSTTGYVLRAAGGAITLDGYVGPIYAISASATPNITFAEW